MIFLDEVEVKEEPQKNHEKSSPKPKKDIFRPYCLKDPDIKPFKLPSYNFKVSLTLQVLGQNCSLLFSPISTTRCFLTSPPCFSLIPRTPFTSFHSSRRVLATFRLLRVSSRSRARSSVRSRRPQPQPRPQLLGNQVDLKEKKERRFNFVTLKVWPDP